MTDYKNTVSDERLAKIVATGGWVYYGWPQKLVAEEAVQMATELQSLRAARPAAYSSEERRRRAAGPSEVKWPMPDPLKKYKDSANALDLSPAEGQVRLSKELTDILAALPPSASGKPHLTFHAAPSNPVISDEMVERGLACYSEGGCSGLDERERREVVTDIITAALSVKPQSGE